MSRNNRWKKRLETEATGTPAEISTNTVIQPAVFIAHGSPMNAITENGFTKILRELGEELRARKPRAAVIFSAHWETEDFQVMASPEPRTIHDFYGFPRRLFEFSYPAKGSPELASEVAEILQYEPASLSYQWGLDHGVWSIMTHLWPKADLPIVAVSLSKRLDPEGHIRAGRLLRNLRRQGVLIIGSGNIVHNLREMASNIDVAPTDWAYKFDKEVAGAIENQDTSFLVNATRSSDFSARKSVPTREHFLPLLPIYGARFTAQDEEGEEKPIFITPEFHHGTLSMRSCLYGV